MAYADNAYYLNYLDSRNIDHAGQSAVEITAALLVATEYLDDTYDFVGLRTVETQDNKWPRVSAFNSEGILLSSTVVPDKIKQATCELAFLELTETGGLQPLFSGDVIKKTKNRLGELEEEIEYDTKASETYNRYYSKAIKKIKDLITSHTGSSVYLVRTI